MAFLYFIVGIVFTYVAIQGAAMNDSVWNLFTVFMALLATFDFAVCIRLFMVHFRTRKQNK
ncbi:DUF4305 domain-containing protein [Pontibacillus salicampi]|uniref:DUF4305 domain-containing protein n=2 Tax=Pontibacillus salicampi TaxID=1449801 RepID=A0ABV6LTT1_9BACI